MSTPRYAVFGHPIAHSLSPRLHALFAEQAGVELEYLAMDIAPADFSSAARSFFAAGGSGANATLPHKAAAFEMADVRTPAAEGLAVANVLTLLPNGRVEADNNDGAGMLADLRAHHGIDPRGCGVLLLGAGGAARAAAFALLDGGARTLAIANRTTQRAESLAAALAQPERVSVVHGGATGLGAPFDLIVNATSAGVQRAPLELSQAWVDPATVAYDLSYGPAARPFLDWARASGCACAFDGLGMLVETAAASFARWHGVRPDADAALRTLREAS